LGYPGGEQIGAPAANVGLADARDGLPGEARQHMTAQQVPVELERLGPQAGSLAEPRVTRLASGSIQPPPCSSASVSVSHYAASDLRAKVDGAERRSPSGPR
jgi:hypothetical protein